MTKAHLPKWLQKLDRASRLHLKECKIKTLREFIETREYQKKEKITCNQCRHIALTLKLEVSDES